MSEEGGNNDGSVPTEDRRAQMFARLNAIGMEREKAREIRKEREVEPDAERESVVLFLEKFGRFESDIRGDVHSVMDKASDMNRESLKVEFDRVCKRANDLQESVAQSSFFLPAYELRQANKTLVELQKHIKSKRDELIPRQKFSFAARRAARRKQREMRAKNLDQDNQSDVKSAVEGTAENAVNDIISKYVKVTYVRDLVNEHVRYNPGDLNGKDVTISNLDGCTVEICDRIGAVRIHNVKNCKIFCGPVQGSMLIEGCKKCDINIASRQIRIHDAFESNFFLHVISNPIIEHSSGVGFASYNMTYEGLDQHMKDAGLLVSVQDSETDYKNMWFKVDDFNWLRQQHSPNWFEIEDSNKPPLVQL